MKINIYYGGRGLVDDPSIAVIKKMQEVLEELRVTVSRYNLYEIRNGITTLPLTLKDVDGVILATTVEWLGIGGYMQQFLDACWLFGDKSAISKLYMFPCVMSKTYGERQAYSTLMDSWEILGGKACHGLSAYVDDSTDFEFNKEYLTLVEKKTEEIYRTISQKTTVLPSSNKAIRTIMKDTINFTPQESEQLSKFVSDEEFVQTQKKDIEELSSMFKDLLVEESNGGEEYYTAVLKKSFKPVAGANASYYLIIDDKKKNVVVDVKAGKLNCYLGSMENAQIVAKLKKDTFDKVVSGRMTFQRAFMTGEITAKGNLKTIKMFDEFFDFGVK